MSVFFPCKVCLWHFDTKCLFDKGTLSNFFKVCLRHFDTNCFSKKNSCLTKALCRISSRVWRRSLKCEATLPRTKNAELSSRKSAMYTVYSIQYLVSSTIYTRYYILYTRLRYHGRKTPSYLPENPQCTLYSSLFTIYSLLYTVDCILYTVRYHERKTPS